MQNYTKKAKDVLVRAKDAAGTLGNGYIGTEHILLGLTLVQESTAAKALEIQNITYHQVMERISEMSGNPKQDGPVGPARLGMSFQRIEHQVLVQRKWSL